MQNLLRVLLIVCVGLMSTFTLAQDDMTTLEIEDTSLSITFPADWEQETTDDGVINLSTDGLMMMVYTPDILAEMFELGDADRANEILEIVATDMDMGDTELDVEAIEIVAINQRRSAELPFETDDMMGKLLVPLLADDTFGLIAYTITPEDVDDVEILMETVDEVVASFDAGAESKADASADTGTETVASDPCSLSTAQANTVQLRVGPGFNRTVIAFLPDGVDFDALGQSTDDDGNVWFRVDESLAAPGKAVNETWLLGTDVTQSGDCSTVVDAAAPPIIPIRQAQPTAVPQTETTTTDATTDTTTASEAPAEQAPAPAGDTVDSAGNFVLAQGSWFLQLNSGTVQCTGGFSGSANPTTGSITAELIGGGTAGFVFDVFVFQYRGTNSYQAAAVFSTSSGGEVVESLTMTMTSSRTGTGNLGYVDGPCTYNAPITLNYIGG